MMKTIRLNYPSAERFQRDYPPLKKGKLFVPLKIPLPPGTLIALIFNFEGIAQTFTAEGVVTKAIDKKTAARFKIPPGVMIRFPDGAQHLLQGLIPLLSANPAYRRVLNPPQAATPADPPAEPSAASVEEGPGNSLEGSAADGGTAAGPEPHQRGLSMAWIKSAVSQDCDRVVTQTESEPEMTLAPPVAEKKTLSAAERDQVKPAGEFIMDLTKAMLRSGYYAAEHPGAKNAKRGLHAALQKSLGDFDEIMISNQEVDGKNDITIMGVVEEPVSVRTLVGEGVSELFVPKLQEFLNRNGLVSLAIKKSISEQKFEKFVDLISAPKTDQKETGAIGKALSKKLAQHGLTEISIVFRDDMIAIEENLPWRVEMAIQRLAKDLKVLPMFKGATDAAISKLKLQNIQDIIRPLRHPEFLKDLVINCYVIAKHLDHMEADEIERAVIESFPLEALLPTSRYIFEELNQLKETQKKNPQSAALDRRFASVKRILQWIANRMVSTDAPGAKSFLEQLYLNEILTFEELPPDVQFMVNTIKMVAEIRRNHKVYADWLLNSESPEDVNAILKLLGRVMPSLLADRDWPLVLFLTKALTHAAENSPLWATAGALPRDPLQFVLEDSTDLLLAAYLDGDTSARRSASAIIDQLGHQGTQILGRVLAESSDAEVIKDVTALLIKKGAPARDWALAVLDGPDQRWQLLEKALSILGCVSEGDSDVQKVKMLAGHSHPRVRDEALQALLRLKPEEAEPMIMAALNDEDEKMRWRAINALSGIVALSGASQMKLLVMLRSKFPEEKDAADKHAARLAQLVRAIGPRTDLTYPEQFEEAILEIVQNISPQEKGLLQRLKKSVDSDQPVLLSSALQALGQIGGPDSEAFLAKLAKSRAPGSADAKSALESIRARNK